MKVVLLAVSLILLIGFASAAGEFAIEPSGFGYDNKEGPVLRPFINYSELPTVNSSDYWNTDDRGSLGSVSDIQHSWLSGLLWSLAGHTMDTTLEMLGFNINMSGGNITNINQLQAPDGSVIKFGNGIFQGIDQAINIQTNQTLGEGVVTHVLTDVQGNRIIEAWQSGKNNSWGFHRNSYGIFGDLGIINASILTNGRYMWQNISIDPLLDYDTTNQGASLGVQYGIESQQLILHDDLGNGQLLGEGFFRWIGRDGDDIDLYEAPVHITDLSIKEFGFDAGDNLTLISENFETGTLGIFTLITSGKGISEWMATTNIDCPPNGLFCGGAGPLGGSLATIMQTNFSTTNLQDMSLNFTLNTDSMASGGVFVVTVNNNVGSGDVTLYSLAGADQSDATITAALPASMEDEPLVTLDFSFLSTHPIRGEVWVDEIQINATTIISTLANVTVSEGKIEFGSGDCNIEQSIISGEGESEMNITCDNINLIGNVTQTSVTEVEVNVTNNVTANNFIARENFYLDDVKINDTFLRLDGASIMTGNINSGGQNIFNVSNVTIDNNLNFTDENAIINFTDTIGELLVASVRPTARGTGYAIGDILNVVQTDATGGQVKVESLIGTGVGTVSLYAKGSNYHVQANRQTTASTGIGSGAQVFIRRVSVDSSIQPNGTTTIDNDVGIKGHLSIGSYGLAFSSDMQSSPTSGWILNINGELDYVDSTAQSGSNYYVTHSPKTLVQTIGAGIGGYNIIDTVNFAIGSTINGLTFGNYEFFTGPSGNENLTLNGIFTFGGQGSAQGLTAGEVNGLKVIASAGFVTADNATGVYIMASAADSTLTKETGLYVEKPTQGSSNFQAVLDGTGDGSGLWFDSLRVYNNGTDLILPNGYTGYCVNASYVGGIVTGCND